jgi:hypothetical protein
MTAEPSAELLADTLGRTLEEAAFVFAEPDEAGAPLDEALLEARLAYVGPHEGELSLSAPRSFAATLAANLLGEDEGGAAATGDDEDAMGELLNMVAGAWVAEVFGDSARCLLGLPRVRPVDAAERAGALAAADVAATLVEEEGRRIDLSLHLARGAGR